MKETFILLGGGLFAGLFIMFLKDFIIKKFKKEVPKLIPEEEKTKLLDLYNKGLVTLNHLKSLGIEIEKKVEVAIPYEAKPLKQKLANDFHPIKLLTSTAKILLVLSVIMGVVYGWGWYQGHQGLQPVLNWHGKEEWVSLNDHYMHIKKDGSMEIVASDKKTILKKLTVKDFENLKKNSRPYGFILEPVGVVGGGISNASTGFEGGIGLRYAKFFKWVADVCLTNKGFYPFGISYKLTDSSAIGLSVGTGFKNGERGFFERYLIKYSFKW